VKKDELITFEISDTFEDTATLAHALGIELEEAEQKSGPFELKVININRPEPADLDQEFFDKIFGKDAVTDIDAFKSKLKDTIQENYQKEADKLFARNIEDYLVDSTSIELPNEFLKRWLLVTNQGKLTAEQIDKDFNYYLRELKWSLIRNKIGQDFGIKVENEEVVEKAKFMIQQQFGGMSFGEEMEETFNKIAENYLQQEKGKNYIKLFEEVFFEKIMSILQDKISVSPKSVTTNEFKAIAGF
jgi:trigger factor